MDYQKYDLTEEARLALNYIDGMTDRAYDYLPYWLVTPHKKPAEAEHCKVDDAELVGSWLEATDSLRGILGDVGESKNLYEGFRRRVLSSWGEHGLRFHEAYPWTHTIHSSFHEMGYILPALNRLVRNNPDDKEAEMRASGLVRGMRSLVIERKVNTFWSGDSYEKKPIYEFPNDVYLKDGGFDLTRHTGRGEQCIRNAVSLHALVDRYVIAGDEVALDLATGMANYLLGPSRYFNYKFEFFGHVHSALWVAAGLIYLYRVVDNQKYLVAGENIYKYVVSLGSSFGWIPEYAQWHKPEDEHCETCCIKDLILCCEELIKCGKTEYWDDMNRFARNQLSENQVKYTGYVVVDNTIPDGNGKTYHDLDKRLLGGYTGGSEPNSISLTRFRSIAGCCVGTGPIALGILWKNVVTEKDGLLVVNLHTDKENADYALSHKMPDEGAIALTLKKDTSAGFRIYPFMGKEWKLYQNGKEVAPLWLAEENVAYVKDAKANDLLELRFPIETIEKKEFFAGKEYTALWRAADVVDLLPHGEHIRLYQRDNRIPKYYPTPDDLEYAGQVSRGPTQQGQVKK